MKSSLLIPTLMALVGIGRTVCIESSPGTGKTSVCREVAKRLDVHYIEHHLPTMLVEDFGIPNISGDVLFYKLLDWYPAKGSRWDDGRGGVLCFDDRNQASNDLQKVLANICQARTLHGVPLADGWSVISTGNRTVDRAGANRVLSHLRNRETVLELTVDRDDWIDWASKHGVHESVVAFIAFKDLLNAFDPNQDLNPTPRSWSEGVSPIIGVVPAESEYDVVRGAVGDGAATEFLAFARMYRSLPNIDACVLNPDTAPVPTELSQRYAVTVGVANRATERNVANVLAYLKRLPADFTAMGAKMVFRQDPLLAQTAAGARFLATDGKLFR